MSTLRGVSPASLSTPRRRIACPPPVPSTSGPRALPGWCPGATLGQQDRPRRAETGWARPDDIPHSGAECGRSAEADRDARWGLKSGGPRAVRVQVPPPASLNHAEWCWVRRGGRLYWGHAGGHHRPWRRRLFRACSEASPLFRRCSERPSPLVEPSGRRCHKVHDGSACYAPVLRRTLLSRGLATPTGYAPVLRCDQASRSALRLLRPAHVVPPLFSAAVLARLSHFEHAVTKSMTGLPVIAPFSGSDLACLCGTPGCHKVAGRRRGYARVLCGEIAWLCGGRSVTSLVIARKPRPCEGVSRPERR
jgi:hypothetical protein